MATVPKPAASLFISAGEASGDWAGALLVEALRRQGCELELRGVGGKRLRQAGVHLLADSSNWGAIGVLAAIPRLPAAYSARLSVQREWQASPPAAAVLIDCGPFNLPLARIARRLGIPTIYYMPPGSWSRRPRSLQLRDLVNVVAAPFPWTRDLLAGGHARVEWVGHPAVESVRPTMTPEVAYAHYGLDPNRPVVALAPGSRAQEVRHLLPALVEAATALANRHPGLQFLVPVAPAVDREQITSCFRRAGLIPTLLEGMEYNALQLAQAAAVCSGTATLEFACLRLPMVVVYRASSAVALQWAVRVRRTSQRFIALPNIVANREVVPELLGRAASPDGIAAAVSAYLSDPEARARTRRDLDEVVAALGGPGASDRTAALVLETIGSRQK